MNPSLTTVVRTSLTRSGLMESYESIAGEISDWKVYVVGGALRDSLVNYFHGTNYAINDLDLALDDSSVAFDKHSFVKNRKNAQLTHTGALMWTTPAFDVNFAPFSYSGSYSIEEHIRAFDCDINAAAYDVDNDRLIDCGAAQAIQRKEVNIQHTHSCDTPSALARLIIQSQRLAFSIGLKSIDYVRHQYTEDMDSEIASYLLRKYKISDPADCISRLRNLI